MLSEAYITKYFAGSDAVISEPMDLSLVISAGTFMYAVSANNFKNVVELCHVQLGDPGNQAYDLTERVSFLVQNYFLNRKKFQKVNISFLNSDFTMVPEAYAEQDLVKPFLKFATGAGQVKNLMQHQVNGMKFCFTPNTDLSSYLERTFSNASIKHAGAVTINLLFSQHALKSCNLFLNIHDDVIELAAKETNNLLFYNVFNYSTSEDILYYLLFMMEQFALNPLYARLCIGGQKPAGDELIQNIKKYIKQVDLCVPDPSVTLEGELGQLPKHYYFTLLNQHLCEL